jgi:hypothetical protein
VEVRARCQHHADLIENLRSRRGQLRDPHAERGRTVARQPRVAAGRVRKDQRVRAGQERAQHTHVELGNALEQALEVPRQERDRLPLCAAFEPAHLEGRLRALGVCAEAVDRVRREHHRPACLESGNGLLDHT